MEEVSIIGLDQAKNEFQAHGAGADGAVVFRRKLSRAQLLKFIAAQSPCIVAMEACASAHHWGRAIGELPKFDTSEANLPWLVCAGHVVSMA